MCLVAAMTLFSQNLPKQYRCALTLRSANMLHKNHS